MANNIEQKIFLIRGLNVMLDRELAELYGVPTKRFPEDFMFQITGDEFKILRSQFATSNCFYFLLIYVFREYNLINGVAPNGPYP